MTKSETGWDKRRMRTIMVLEAVRDHARRGFTWETPAGLLCDPPVEYPEGTTEDQVKRALTQLRKEGVVTYERPGGGTDGTPGGWRSLCDYGTCHPPSQCQCDSPRA